MTSPLFSWVCRGIDNMTYYMCDPGQYTQVGRQAAAPTDSADPPVFLVAPHGPACP